MSSKKILFSLFGFVIGLCLVVIGFVLLFDGQVVNNSSSRYEQEKQAQIELYGYYDKNKEILTEYENKSLNTDWKIFVSIPSIVFGGALATLSSLVLDKENYL